MSDDRIWTLHPQGKQGSHITLAKYTQVKDYILKTLATQGEMTFQELNDFAIKELTPDFDGKVPWYVVTVKLDLEARGQVIRMPGNGSHRLKVGKG